MRQQKDQQRLRRSDSGSTGRGPEERLSLAVVGMISEVRTVQRELRVHVGRLHWGSFRLVAHCVLGV